MSGIETQPIEPALARELAKYELGSIGEMRKILLDEHSSSYRWLIASLLAVNGGSALGLFGSTIVSLEVKLQAGFAFFIGTFLSLLCAFFSQGAVKKVTIPLTTLAGFWVAVSHDGHFISRFTSAYKTICKSRRKRDCLLAFLVGYLRLLSAPAYCGRAIRLRI